MNTPQVPIRVEQTSSGEIHTHINLSEVVAELYAPKVSPVIADALRKIASIVEERIADGDQLTATDVVGLLRRGADMLDAPDPDAAAQC